MAAMSSAVGDFQRSASPLVSIAIPSYNHARFIQQTIQSVIDQDYANIELIVIDDGSQDDSAAMVREMIPACEQRFTRFSFVHRSNKGLSATLNEALQWAQGEYFSTIASDDVMYPRKTSTLLAHLAGDPDTAGVFCGSDILDIHSKVVGTTRCADAVFTFEDILLWRYSIMAPTQLLRLEYLRQVGGYLDGIYIEDWYMWLALSQRGYKLRVIDEVLVGYRQHDSNISTNALKMLAGRIAILALYRDNPNYQASLAIAYMWAAIDFTAISKLQSVRYLLASFRADKRIAISGKFQQCILRIIIPRAVLLWLKRL
jgi:alpha-1,3-rhamnosyltransferase